MAGHLAVQIHHRLSRVALEVELDVGRETLAMVGPSGAGKSTVLRAIAGLLRADGGRIALGEHVLFDAARGVDVPPDARRVGLVDQHGALFPFLSVLDNVAFGVRARRARRGRRGCALAVLERFGIASLAGARPAELSGGERQRVALARAVASEPDVLLLDEPLSALDAATKAAVAAELAARTREVGVPTVLVSHDFADVVGLADRVAVLHDGTIVQQGPPGRLVEEPASGFVASLTGVNYLRAVATRGDGLTRLDAPGWATTLSTSDEATGPVGVVVHPWEVSLSASPPAGSALNHVDGRIAHVVVLGNRARVTLDGPPRLVAEVTEASVRALALAPGARAVATWKATATRVVPAAYDRSP